MLLRFGGPETRSAVLEKAAASRNVPLCICDIADEATQALHERCLALVRPDGHVAWRGDELADLAEAVAVIDRVRGEGGVAPGSWR